MTLSEIRRVLAERGIQLTKSLGQNFLHDHHQLGRIVAAAELSPADRVLEIGPGLGPLTELLAQRAGHVLAIEKDRRMVEFLETKFACTRSAPAMFPAQADGPAEDGPRLHLLHADALDFLKQNRCDWSGWKLVANLPYSVASPILVELSQAPVCPDRLVATLQLEVARRLVARADEDDYGVLTLLVQLRYEAGPLFKIPASCFFPEPAVESGCVTLRRRAQPLLAAGQSVHFTRLVKLAFSQRRKMMFKLLKAGWPVPRLEAVFAEVSLSRQVRAEAVDLAQFVRLTQLLGAPQT